MNQERKKVYERKRTELLMQCAKCQTYQTPTPDHCNYDCNIGNKLRWLEAEYADVTGWRHQTWNKGE